MAAFCNLGFLKSQKILLADGGIILPKFMSAKLVNTLQILPIAPIRLFLNEGSLSAKTFI